MQTRLPPIRAIAVLVVATIACIVAAIATWHSFGGTLPLQAQGYRVTVRLPDASNLFAHADVRIAGVNVGSVRDVRRSTNSAEVTLEVKSRFAPLHTGTRATLRTKTLLGEPYVQLTLGSPSAPAIPEGGALTHVDRAQNLDDVLSTFAPGTRSQLRSLLAGMSGALGSRGDTLNGDIGLTQPATTGLAGVVGALDDQRAPLSQLLSDTADVLDAAGGHSATLQAAVIAGDRVLSATAKRNRALSASVAALPRFLTRLRRTSDDLNTMSAPLNRAVAALGPVADRAVPALHTLSAAAPEFTSLFRALPGVLAAGDRGLPAVSPITRSTAAAAPEIYVATRELIPLTQLAAANRRSIIGVLANVGQIFNGTYTGPGGSLLDYVAGLPTFWNEVVGGWAKRLPTNRFNPYPKPDSAFDIATGPLKSYDCRNLGNRLYLPAFGASPACVEQGPWTFNGTTAEYPRLEPAGP